MGFPLSSPDDDYRIATMAGQNGTTELPGPSMFEGALESIPKGIGAGMLNVEQAMGGLHDRLGGLLPDTLGADYSAGINAEQGDVLSPANRATTQASLSLNGPGSNILTDQAKQLTAIDPKDIGSAGQLMGGLAKGFTEFGVGSAAGGPWGAASLLGGSEGYADYLKGKQEGLDDNTAMERAGVVGLTSAAGAFLPVKFEGGALASIGKSAAANLGFGMSQRFATSAVLDANGYHDMAQQYRVFDGEAMLADTILGAGFGAMARLHPEQAPRPSDIDAAAAVATEDHFNRSAPGIPTEPDVANAHADVMRQSLDDLAAGRDPDVAPEVAQRMAEATVPDPIHPTSDFIHEAGTENVPGFDQLVRPVPEEALIPREPISPEAQAELPPRPASVDDLHADMLDHLIQNAPDAKLPYTMPDGSVKEVTPAELADQLNQEQSSVSSLSRLHDIAAACFLRTGGAA